MNSVTSYLPSPLPRPSPSALISVVVIAAVWLRWHFASEPLWVDELHTVWVTNGPLSDVAFRAGQGNQTPLYFWLIWLIKRVFGDSELVLRVPSVVLGLLTLVVAGRFVWNSSRSVTAVILTAAIIAVDAQMVFYSTEARPYVLVQLLAIIQITVLSYDVNHAAKEKSLSLLWLNWKLVLLTAMLLLTHLTAIWIVIAEVSFVAMFWNRVNVPRLLISLTTGVLLGLLPSFAILYGVFEKRDDWLVVYYDAAAYVRESSIQIAILILLPSLLMVSSHLMLRRNNNGKSGTQPPVMFLLACCAILPMLCCAALQLAEFAPIAAYRYSLVGSVAFPIFCGLAIAKIQHPAFRRISAVVVLAVAVSFNPIIDSFIRAGQLRFRTENWKNAIDTIASSGRSANPIFLFANLVEDHRAATLDSNVNTAFTRYLSFPLTGQFELPQPNTIIPMPTMVQHHWNLQHLQQILEHHGGWLVFRSTPETADAIADELGEFGLRHHVKLAFSVALFEWGNDVLVMKIDVVDDSADQREPNTAD